MKKLFTAIRKNDIITVKCILDGAPELISCISTGAPKKEEGQSLLQVALKSSNTEIISYLLNMGADVNFIESADTANLWRAPVIHDAINRAIMSSRWNVKRDENIEVFNSKEISDEAFELLKKIITLGADVNAKDSFGNACLDRACLQARQILPTVSENDRVLTEELDADLKRIFRLLINSGADLNYICPNGSGKTYLEQYKNEVLEKFLI